jgi:hypothetical protein
VGEEKRNRNMSNTGNAEKLSEPAAWFISYLNSLTDEKIKDREENDKIIREGRG